MGLFSKDMGIDLGTASTLIYIRGEGIVLHEPSVVAVKRGTNRVLKKGEAVGDTAKFMLGKTPGNIIAIRPLKDGVIADFDITEVMLRYFIRKAHTRKWVNPRVVIAVPKGITTVEKRAVRNSAERAGAREVYLIEEPMAAGIGIGLPIQEPTGNMIVDIGGGTTEVAVISLAGIVTSESLRVAGDEMDDAIVQHMKRAYNMMIGERTSENIKFQIGSAYPMEKELTMEVKGRDLIAGLPRQVTVRSEEIREALQEPIEQILASVKSALERTPPELAADLIDRGIWLAGGGSLLKGLDKVIEKETALPAHIAEDPITCVARGTGAIIEHLETLKEILEVSEDES